MKRNIYLKKSSLPVPILKINEHLTYRKIHVIQPFELSSISNGTGVT